MQLFEKVKGGNKITLEKSVLVIVLLFKTAVLRKNYDKSERENFTSSVIIFSEMDDCENIVVISLLR